MLKLLSSVRATLINSTCYINAVLLATGMTATAAERTITSHDTIYYVRTDGNNGNSGLGDSKDEAWADPQYALSFVENKLDFGQYRVAIHIDAASGENNAWRPPDNGYVCRRIHLGSGELHLEGDKDKETIIDGAPQNGAAISAINGCEIFVHNLTLASGAGGNSLQAIGSSQVFFRDIRWGPAASAQIFVSRGARIEQLGDDVITSSAAYHILASHEGHFRAQSVTTRFSSDVNFTVFAFASALGDITYTGSPPTPYPKFELGGKTVLGVRCLADAALVQAASYGPNFFPGDKPCLTQHGGQVIN